MNGPVSGPTNIQITGPLNGHTLEHTNGRTHGRTNGHTHCPPAGSPIPPTPIGHTTHIPIEQDIPDDYLGDCPDEFDYTDHRPQSPPSDLEDSPEPPLSPGNSSQVSVCGFKVVLWTLRQVFCCIFFGTEHKLCR